MHEDIFAHPPVALPPLPDPNLFTKPPGLLSPFHAESPSYPYKTLVRLRTPEPAGELAGRPPAAQ
jgi:hypothetical protein